MSEGEDSPDRRGAGGGRTASGGRDGVEDPDRQQQNGADAMDAIELLADETRVAILRELAEHKRAAPGDPTLSFSELRERVGAVDSGRFNYHLGKLEGRFVREAGTGYELAYAGQAVIDAAGDAVRTTGATGAPTDGEAGASSDGDGEAGERCEVCGEVDCNRRIHIHLGWR